MESVLKARSTLDMRPGDVVRVHQKIQEGEKTRIQIFEGLVIARKHGQEAGATFTVRKMAEGVGVERIYPLYSPNIERIEIVKRSPKIRRAKLYYIREKAAKAQRRKLKHEILESKISTDNSKSELPVDENIDKEEVKKNEEDSSDDGNNEKMKNEVEDKSTEEKSEEKTS